MIDPNHQNYAANVSALGKEVVRKIANSRIQLVGDSPQIQATLLGLIGLGVGQITHYSANSKPKNGIIADLATAIGFGNLSWSESLAFIAPQINYENQRKQSKQEIKRLTAVNIRQNTTIQTSHDLIFGLLQTNQILNTIINSQDDNFQTNPQDKSNFSIPISHQPLIPKHALIIGAGGLGTYCTYILTKNKTPKITLIDPDRIEDKNFNRQLFYLNAPDEYKAITLAKRLSTNYSIIDGQIKTFNANYKIPDTVDAIYCCTDNIPSRINASNAAQELRIPLIEGACTPTKGCIATYLPNYTMTVKDQRSLDNLLAFQQQEQINKAIRQTNERQTSCSRAANPSIITPNVIIGALQAIAIPNTNYNHANLPTNNRLLLLDLAAENKLYYGGLL